MERSESEESVHGCPHAGSDRGRQVYAPPAFISIDSRRRSSLPPSPWTLSAKSVKLTSDSQELVVFVGFPASGKSTFAERYFVPKGYVRVNQVPSFRW